MLEVQDLVSKPHDASTETAEICDTPSGTQQSSLILKNPRTHLTARIKAVLVVSQGRAESVGNVDWVASDPL